MAVVSAVARDSQPTPGAEPRVRLLVIEDEAIVARHITSTLAKRGFEVSWVTTGEEAVRRALELEPALIVADVNLGGEMDGIEAIARIREERDVGAVFLTAYSDPSTLDRAIATSPAGFVVKPFTERALTCAIEVALARQAAERAERAASMTDELTGLYNRRAFRTMAELQLRIAARHGRDYVLYFIDLDGLKRINDTLGHERGDAAIREAAQILGEAFRESDIVARLGGDEFAALAIDCSPSAASLVRDRIASALAERARAGAPYRIEMSIGMVLGCEARAGDTLDSLLARADAAMYQEKRRRRQGRG